MKLLLSSLLILLAFPTVASAARLNSIGFELGSAAALMEVRSVVGVPTIDSTTKRSGDYSMRFSAAGAEVSAEVYPNDGSASDQAIRAYFYFTDFPESLTKIIQLSDSGGDHTSLRINSDGTLELWNDPAATQYDTDSSALSLNTWYRLELQVGTTHAGDDVRAFIDGVEFANNATHSAGADFRYAEVGIMGAVTADVYVDDVALNDTTGTAQTGLPGAGSIVHMQPDSAGDNNGCSAGDFDSVNEVTPDNGTSFCNLDANADILDVNMETFANTGATASSITLVQVAARADNTVGTATGSFACRIKSQASGTTSTGTERAIESGGYWTHDDTTATRLPSLTSYTDPQAGGAWTTTLLDSAQIGVSSADATPDVQVTAVWALVEYIPSEAPAAGASAPVPIIWFTED